MSPAQWRVQSLCPDWTVREVVGHLAGVEQMLAGWLPGSADELPPAGRVTAFAQQTAGLDEAAFTARVAQTFGQRRADLAALSEDDLSRPSWTPVGPASYGSFMAIRVFDFWVHERDITTPLGLPADDGDARAEMALAEVERSLGYIVGKRGRAPDGSSVLIRLSGPVERDLAVVVDGRARVVDAMAGEPTATLTLSSSLFMRLAGGREDPETALGRIELGGDEALARQLATSLAYTV